MKHMPVLLIAALMACLLSCSKDKPTAPGGDEYDLIASETIGPAGGMLEDEDFTLTVPPGAFSDDAQLRLSVSSDHRPFGETQATYGYRLENLPGEISRPLTLCIRYRRDLEGESFIAVGQEGTALGLDIEEVLYDFVPAADSSGYLVGRFPETPAGRSKRTMSTFNKAIASGRLQNIPTFIHGLTDQATARSAHFELLYPSYLITIRDDLLSALESAVDVFEGIFPDQITWVTHLDVYRFEHDDMRYALPYLMPCGGGHLEYRMMISERLLTPEHLPEMRVVAGAGYMTLCLAHLWSDRSYGCEWFYDALELWLEEKLAATSDHVPHRFPGCEMAPFQGIQGKEVDWEYKHIHKYGMSALFKYLSDDDVFGEDGLLRLHRYNLDNHPQELLDGLIASIDAPLNQCWPDFFREYVSGNIYHVALDVFLSNVADVFHTNAGPSVNFYGNLPDLSARLYGVVLDDRNVGEEDKLRFAVISPTVPPEDLMVLVFGCRDGGLEFLGAGDELMLGDLKGLTEGGWDLLAVVVNSHKQPPYYWDLSDVYLAVDRIEADLIYDGWTSILSLADFRLQRPGDEDDYSTQVVSWMFPPWVMKVYSAPLTGDNVFSDALEYTFGENTAVKESIWVDLDHDLGRIESFTVELWSESPSSRKHYLLSATDLPKVAEDTRELEYGVYDEAVFQQISTIQYTETDLNTGAVTTLLQPVSGTGQYIRLGLRKPLSQGGGSFDPSGE